MAPRSIIGHSRRAPRVAAVCLGLWAAFAPTDIVAEEFDDLSVIVPAVNEALETRRTGMSVRWSNLATGGAGTISILRTYYRPDGVPCREYERTTERAGSGATVVLGVGCRVGPNFWQLEEDAGTEAETETAARVAVEAPAAEEPAAAPKEERVEDEIILDAGEPTPEAIEAIEEPVILSGSIPTESNE